MDGDATPTAPAHETGERSDDIGERLDAIREAGLYRRMRLIEGPQGAHVLLDGRQVLLLCSNNYLGLADDPAVKQAAVAAIAKWGAGSGASRLISGNMEIHERLERRLAAFHCKQAALLFGSGYLANTGVIAALAPRGSVVYSDELNHASIVDGCRLARADVCVYRHRDVEHLAWAMENATGPASLIVTDGLFSMDGDIAPLGWLLELARKHGARLMVDEAHAVGALGAGRGSVAEAGLVDEVDVVVGTLGKSLGSYGAYVCADREIRELLVNSARPLIFSTGLPPASVAAAEAALGIIESEPRRLARLVANAAVLRAGLAAQGLGTEGSRSQIIPVQIGDPERAVAACSRALDEGVFAQAIRPPTVPEGTSRLRLSVIATHTEDEMRRAADVIGRAVQAVGADGEWSIELPEPDGEPVVYRTGAAPDEGGLEPPTGDGPLRVTTGHSAPTGEPGDPGAAGGSARPGEPVPPIA